MSRKVTSLLLKCSEHIYCRGGSRFPPSKRLEVLLNIEVFGSELNISKNRRSVMKILQGGPKSHLRASTSPEIVSTYSSWI